MNHTLCYRAGYPRPQFVRENWTDLNGKWNFAFDDGDVGEREKWNESVPQGKEIVVPFAYQTQKSGIFDPTYHKTMWYSRTVRFGAVSKNERVIIHFEGVDSDCKVWCNGAYIGSHTGGYCRFSMDITDALINGQGLVVVKAVDDRTCTKPRGKQSWQEDAFGCWYAPTSGIWKSVWAEKINAASIKRVKMSPRADTYDMTFEYETQNATGGTLTTKISFGGKTVAEQTVRILRENHTFTIDLTNDEESFKIHWWTPENPQLYDVVFTLRDKDGKVTDEVRSYTAFRIFRADKNKLMLNLNPVYMRMVLAQGYWHESGLTPPDEDAIVREIELAKRLGFNGIRMHQKTEDERFYYYADIAGMMVFCEMPSAYEFKDVSVEKITAEWTEVVKQNYNHPCVVAWVPVNESWGVNRLTYNANEADFTKALYYLTKAYDGMRPVISNDGWEHTESDIVSFHNYCQSPEELERFLSGLEDVLAGKNRNDYTNLRLPFVEGHGYRGQPVMIDEFAGIGFENKSDKGWGYGDMVNTREAFAQRLSGLVKAVRKIDGICGFCVTQLTDVYQEINGLFDFDREPKVEEEILRKAIVQ